MRRARLSALVATFLLVAAAGKVLEDQDVVRMVVARKPIAEILDAIRAHDVKFDLSEEMLVELRLAGVGETVIAAMRERQACMPVPAAPEPPPADERKLATVRVLLEVAPSRKDAPAAVWLPDRIEEDRARQLQLENGPEARTVHDVAIFLACLTPEHVPDQWRTRSPLGLDFVAMPRHEMLVLRAGAVRDDPSNVPRLIRAGFPAVRGDEPPAGMLRLDLPEALEAHVERTEPHRLFVGIAFLVGDRYLLVAGAERPGIDVSSGEIVLRARIVQGKTTKDGAAIELVDAAAAPP